MKKALIIGLMGLMGLIGPVGAWGQTEVDLDAEVGGRLSFNLNKKITKGWHINLEEEVRFDDNFSSFNRFHTTLSTSYKVLPNLKLALGYSLINGYNSEINSFRTPRHRLFADVNGTYRYGDWQFALRERVQVTHRTDAFNEYQNPGNAWMLKSRLKVSYKGFRRWTPYGSIEMRNTLNAPVIKANWDGTNYVTDAGSQVGEEGWFLDGFSGVYVNRWRGVLGVDYRIDRESNIEVYLMADYCTEKEVDANAEGTKLKSYVLEKGFNGWLCVSYSYSF